MLRPVNKNIVVGYNKEGKYEVKIAGTSCFFASKEDYEGEMHAMNHYAKKKAIERLNNTDNGSKRN